MVKSGYKQTEVGVIPEDWEVDTIGSVCTSVAIGGNYQNSTIPSDFPLIKMGNLSRGSITLEKVEYIRAAIPDQKDLLHYGDVLFNARNTPELVGKVAIWRDELPKAYYNSNLLRFIFDLEKADPFYMNLALNTKETISSFRNIAKGTTSVAAIYPQDLLRVLIPIPPITEQKRIAEALSDMDKLISSLEKLIEKKKAIKQGAMQELLTGKRRLPGFSGEWNTARFGDLFVICPNNAFTRDQLTIGGKIKNIHYGDILTKYGEYLDGSSASIPTLEKSLTTKKYPDNAFVQSGDVIVADTAEDLTVGKAVEIVNVCGKMLSGQHTFLCRPIIPFAPMYLGYYMNSADFHDQIIPFVTGTKVSSISKASLCSLIICYPETPEQETIAEVLANIDNSIVALQIKLLKAQKIKQGMMQQLLTGKVRLG